jgi:hypothetical protein
MPEYESNGRQWRMSRSRSCSSKPLAVCGLSSAGPDVHDKRRGDSVVGRVAEFEVHSAPDESKLQHGAAPDGAGDSYGHRLRAVVWGDLRSTPRRRSG